MLRTIGKSVPRVEDDRLLRGAGVYIDDVEIPGALHVAFLRSPMAHARIGAVDASAALALPGVHGVFTHADLGALGLPLPMKRGEHPGVTHARTARPMACDKTFYVGQILAMVVADSRYVAEDALDCIEIDLEQLPAVASLEAAAAEGSVVLHDGVPGNVAGRIRQQVGDIDEALAGADLVFSARFELDRSAAMPMETRGMAARFDPVTRELTVWTNSQTLAPLRSAVAGMMGLAESAVRLIVPDTGGGFGVKGSVPYPEEVLIPWAAMRLGRPVRWMEDRTEHFIGSHHERKQIHSVTVAADRDGVVHGLRDSFLMDNGAFTPYGLELGRVTASHIGGPYRIPAIDVEVAGIYSNVMMSTPYRGAGRPHACFTYERTMDRVARRLGLDRAEVRRRNFVRADEFPYARPGLSTVDDCTVTLDSGCYEKQLDMLLEAIGYAAFPAAQAEALAQGRYLGLGLAFYVEATGMGPYEGAKIEVLPSTGKVVLATGVTTQGQSHLTTFAQIAAERLGIAAEDITVVTGDTQAFPWGVGTYASRALVMSGNAIHEAARKLADKALLVASRLFGEEPDDLEMADGFVRSRASNQSLSFRQLAIASRPGRWPPPGGASDPEVADLARFPAPWPGQAPLGPGEEPGLEAIAYFAADNATWGGGAHAAIVEVDPATGRVDFLRYVIVHDCGVEINPKVVEGQVLGGLAQGIGGALYERIVYDEQGQLINGSFMDFLIPYATEIPQVSILHTESPSPMNPLGVKGVGEAGTIPVCALVASAVEDALSPFGIEIDTMPIDPAAIRDLIRTAPYEDVS